LARRETEISGLTRVAPTSHNIFSAEALTTKFFAFETAGALDIAVAWQCSVVVFGRERKYGAFAETCKYNVSVFAHVLGG